MPDFWIDLKPSLHGYKRVLVSKLYNVWFWYATFHGGIACRIPNSKGESRAETEAR